MRRLNPILLTNRFNRSIGGLKMGKAGGLLNEVG